MNTADIFSKHFRQHFRNGHARGEGMILQGARDWTDYAVEADMMLHLGLHGGLVIRAQGQRRFYAARITRDGCLEIVRRRDDEETVLASTACEMPYETAFTLRLVAKGRSLRA